MTVWAGPDKVDLRPGDYYAIPMNVPHAIQAGPEGARALNISSPAGFAELITRAGTPTHLATAETEFDAICSWPYRRSSVTSSSVHRE